MTHHSSVNLLKISQSGPCRDFQHPRSHLGSHSTLIHILNNDSLLNMFFFCRPVILDESEASNMQILQGGNWNRERWWYRLVQVCRRWRYLVLDSASYLRLSLVCTRGTSVADMLAHSPCLPLTIDYLDGHYITAEEEKGITFALQHHDRVCRIRLRNSILKLQRLVNALDGEFPILEYLYIDHHSTIEYIANLTFPKTFRTPHLRHFLLMNSAIPIESTLLSNTRNLVTLSLNLIPPTAYFHPNALLQRLLLMPQLEILWITSNDYDSSSDVERRLLHRPIMTRVTLPNLRWLGFRGANAYLEALLPWVSIPLLEKIQVYFINQLTYSIPHLQQSMITGNLRLKAVTLTFREDHFHVSAFPHKGARMSTLDVELSGIHLDWQVASAAQVFRTLSTVFSTVEDLYFNCDRRLISLEWNDEADRTQWRELLGSLNNVKTILMSSAGGHSMIEQLSRALQPDEGESPMALLPELQELAYFPPFAFPNALIPFIEARQKTAHPLTVTAVRF